MKKISLAIPLIALLVGCSTPATLPIETSITKERTYNASYDQVWSAVISGIAESNLNINTLEKDSGIVAISNTTYDPSWANEGLPGSVLGVPDQVMDRVATFNIFTTKQVVNTTRVQVNSSFKMNVRHGNGSQAFPFIYQWRQVYSNGNLERNILDSIERKINQH